jgi:biotin-dependent carboxylase-like uncharacterized protein
MIKVLHPGMYSTIQDQGRTGFAMIGVPISGAMDVYSSKLGNQILNNNLNDAVVEITFGGAKFQFDKELVVCLTGANFNPMIDGVRVDQNLAFKVKKDTILSFGKKEFGVRTYLCVQGGFDTEAILKSKSFYTGITSQSILKKGDVLPVFDTKMYAVTANSKIKVEAKHFTMQRIECTIGPEFNLLSKKQQNLLTESVFTISNDNNRMGYRLEEIVKNDFKDILTSGVLPGTVQLTPSGKLIVLMRDCQVTGGYPRVLQLTKESINILAQKTTNNTIRFSVK